MSNLALVFATVKTGLAEIAKQSTALAEGLQNAAPAEKKNAPNNSIEYLFNISKMINQYLENCESTLSQSNKNRP